MTVSDFGVLPPVGAILIKPILVQLFNFTGDTLVEGDCVVEDYFGITAGADFTAEYGADTHPSSRVIDIDSLSLGLYEHQNLGISYVYVGKTGAYDEKSCANLTKGFFLMQGFTRKVKTLATAAENAAYGAPIQLFGIPATPNASKALSVATIGSTTGERVLFRAKARGTDDVITAIPGIFIGSVGAGWGRPHF